jgi:hypothetical protein
VIRAELSRSPCTKSLITATTSKRQARTVIPTGSPRVLRTEVEGSGRDADVAQTQVHAGNSDSRNMTLPMQSPFPLREGHCAANPLVPELADTGKHLGVLRCLSSRADVVGGSCPTGNCSLTGGENPLTGVKRQADRVRLG